MTRHEQTPQNHTPTTPAPTAAAKVLTAISVAKLRPKGERFEVRDAGARGLRVTVQPSGFKSFHLRFWHRGKSHNLTLGPVLEGASSDVNVAPVIGAPMTLADARMLATTVLREIKSGRDPGSLLRRPGPTANDSVAAIAADYMTREGGKLRSGKRRRYDLDLMCETLGQRPIADVKISDLARARDRIEADHGASAADRALASWGTLAGWHAGRSDDYQPPVIRRLRRKQEERERVLTDAELCRVWQGAGMMGAPFGSFVRFLLLTACRRTEASEMVRSELVDPATWLIPAARVKTAKDVTIPLSGAAQAVIASLPVISPGQFVFTTDGRRPIGAFTHFKKRLDTASGVTGWRLHDLRRTARTLLSRAGVAADVAERCLGHAIGGVRGVYDRHRYESEMRDAFERLAAQIAAIVK